MATADDPGDVAYYAALGRVVESSGTLEHLIYMTAEFVFDLANMRRSPARKVLDRIQKAADEHGLLVDKATRDAVDAWAVSCKSVLEQRNGVVHVVSVFDGRSQLSGVRRTNDLAAPLRVRDAHHMELLRNAISQHSQATARMFQLLSELRRVYEPGWEMRYEPGQDQ